MGCGKLMARGLRCQFAPGTGPGLQLADCLEVPPGAPPLRHPSPVPQDGGGKQEYAKEPRRRHGDLGPGRRLTGAPPGRADGTLRCVRTKSRRSRDSLPGSGSSSEKATATIWPVRSVHAGMTRMVAAGPTRVGGDVSEAPRPSLHGRVAKRRGFPNRILASTCGSGGWSKPAACPQVAVATIFPRFSPRASRRRFTCCDSEE